MVYNTELAKFVTSKEDHIFLKPGSSNQATFDALLISGGGALEGGIITLFQMTVGENHSIKDSGLDFVWDALRAAMSRVEKDASAPFSPPQKNQWRLVFCILDNVKDKWSRPQSIQLQAGAKRVGRIP